MAYANLWKIADRAYSNPKEDWTDEIRAVASDQLASNMLEGITSMRKAGRHNVGHSQISITVVDATASRVAFRACVDTTGVDTVDSSGKSVRSGNGPNAYWTYVQTATFISKSGKWIAQDAVGHMDEQC